MNFETKTIGTQVFCYLVVNSAGEPTDDDVSRDELFECTPDDAQRLVNQLQLTVNEARRNARTLGRAL